MLYFNGDDPVLESDFIDAFNKMAKVGVGSNDEVNIVIQFDRIPGHDTSFGDWTIANRYFLKEGMLPKMENAIQDWGDQKGGREVQMDDPETLSDFIKWGANNYPAEKYILFVADHGFAWQGISLDATSDDNYMFLPELKQAILNSGITFDLIALDACLMQTIEVAYELKACDAKVMVGSQNPGSAWPFWLFLPQFIQNPDQTAEQLGKAIIDSYSVSEKSNNNATLASLNFETFDTLIDTFNVFVTSMTDGSDFSNVQRYALAVMNQIEKTIMYQENHGEWDTIANGLSIYFPMKTTLFRPEIFAYYYIGKMTAFAEDLHWRDFLNIYYDPMSSKQPISPFLYHIRDNTKTFVASDNIDLYDFCKKIVNYE